MRIIDFTAEQIPQAAALAAANYEEERLRVAALPPYAQSLQASQPLEPLVGEFAENGLGVAAFEGERMVGFLGACAPFDNAFGTTGVRGVFSPIHAHGAVYQDREKIYQRLYQAAADKWVAAGAISHAAALYEHDRIGQRAFYRYGFGLRCVDAIRYLEAVPTVTTEFQCEYAELSPAEAPELAFLNNMLIAHLGKSPCFISYPSTTGEALSAQAESNRFFAAIREGKPIAYLRLSSEGETFVTLDDSMPNISGAACLPQYRGSGVAQNLLAYLTAVLAKEGYTRLGVDFESFNPTARGFWLKHFTAYTAGVVRRVDDYILQYR